MKARIFQSLIPLLGLLAVTFPPVFADEREERETTKRITHLIGMLASRNTPPKIVGDRKPDAFINFDRTYDKNLQVHVYLAMQQLLAEDEAALDLLLKHEDDKRYCLSLTVIELDENETVGVMCNLIFWAKIRPFENELRFMTRDQWGVYPRSKKSDKEWWEGKKKLGLARVQIEAIDAELEFMQKAEAKKASAIHPNAERLSRSQFERRRKENIQILKAMRETIVSTGKPYRPKTCLAWSDSIIGLPWTGATHR